jgi:hypothetical protein
MILDTEDQRQIILQLIAASNIPGAALDTVFTFKAAVMAASIGSVDETANPRLPVVQDEEAR